MSKNAALQKFFNHSKTIPSGVCSIQLHENEAPWVVCPRRLFYVGSAAPWNPGTRIAKLLIELSKFPNGSTIGAWSEVKLKHTEETKDGEKSFDYTFDYILMPLGEISEKRALEESGLSRKELATAFKKSGLSLKAFPVGSPAIVETT